MSASIITQNQTPEQMMAEIAALKAENAKLAQAKAQASADRVSFKVTEKGAVSCYGMGRFPVTLYKEQWERLLARQADLKAFLVANNAKLAVKGAASPLPSKPATAAPVAPVKSAGVQVGMPL